MVVEEKKKRQTERYRGWTIKETGEEEERGRKKKKVGGTQWRVGEDEDLGKGHVGT